MSGAPFLLDVPKRMSLPVQAAEVIRKGIETGVWKEYLPSERRLCEALQISRPTVRTALHMIAKEGGITIWQGRRNRIIARGTRVQSPRNRSIAIVTQELFSGMTGSLAYWGVSEMRAHLTEHGFATEIFVCKAHGLATQQRKLETFLRENQIFCCLLVSVSRELQQWFATHSIPALVLGTCHASVRLPSFDVDYRSVCRHAAGVFLKHRHRQLAFLVAQAKGAGNLASEQGFLEAVGQQHRTDPARAVIARHNSTVQSLTDNLDALFNSPQPPTALLIGSPHYVFIVIIYLLKRGLSVPKDVSVIARDQNALFSDVNPRITHYNFEVEAFTNRLTRLMLKMAGQKQLPTKANLIFPRFFAGGTVKSLPDR
jgi:DNA-binding LacI/PurR family transcriptional regulator